MQQKFYTFLITMFQISYVPNIWMLISVSLLQNFARKHVHASSKHVFNNLLHYNTKYVIAFIIRSKLNSLDLYTAYDDQLLCVRLTARSSIKIELPLLMQAFRPHLTPTSPNQAAGCGPAPRGNMPLSSVNMSR